MRHVPQVVLRMASPRLKAIDLARYSEPHTRRVEKAVLTWPILFENYDSSMKKVERLPIEYQSWPGVGYKFRLREGVVDGVVGLQNNSELKVKVNVTVEGCRSKSIETLLHHYLLKAGIPIDIEGRRSGPVLNKSDHVMDEKTVKFVDSSNWHEDSHARQWKVAVGELYHQHLDVPADVIIPDFSFASAACRIVNTLIKEGMSPGAMGAVRISTS
jgi:hypothetical protein